MLEANIHLNRVRGAEVRRNEVQAVSLPGAERAPHVDRIAGRTRGQRCGLKGFLFRDDLWVNRTDRLATVAIIAVGFIVPEQSRGQTARRVKQHVVPNRIFVIDSAARAYHRLAMFCGIPDHSHDGSEVAIGLMNRIAQPLSKGVEGVQRTQLRIAAPRVTNVVKPQGDIQVRQDLPVIGNVPGKARIKLSTRGKAKLRDGRVIADAVGEDRQVNRIVQWIVVSAGEWPFVLSKVLICSLRVHRTGEVTPDRRRELPE